MELVWLPLDEVKQHRHAGDHRDRAATNSKRAVAEGFSHDLPVPFYRMLHGSGFVRELLVTAEPAFP